MSDVFLALLHHPVLDKNGQIVTTAITNMDIHDIARSARTYGVRRFFVVTPVRALRILAERIIEHWKTGFGSTYNVTRKEALAAVAIEPDLDAALLSIERETGQRPVLVVTSARPCPDVVRFAALRRDLETGQRPVLVVTSARPCPDVVRFAALRRDLETGQRPHLLIFGTGWGLAPGNGTRRPASRAGVRPDQLQSPLRARGRRGHS
jgi:hypothetical protein